MELELAIAASISFLMIVVTAYSVIRGDLKLENLDIANENYMINDY